MERRPDPITLAAIGANSGLLMLMAHEVLGHCFAAVISGGHLVRITSVDSAYNGNVSAAAVRVIAAAGIAVNLVVGWLVLVLFRRSYFAWIYGHAMVFMGAGYLGGFAFLPFGDVHAVLAGLPFQLVWQVLAVIAGAAIYRVAFLDAQRTARSNALIPYLAMGATVTVGALFNPAGPINGALWGAAATFGASYVLLVASKDSPVPDIARSGRWIAAGVVAAILLVCVLGPGIEL